MAMDERARLEGWYLHALGTWVVTRDGEEVPLPPRVQRLLALLLVDGRRPRSYLAGRLWPDSSQVRASANLRSATLDLRRRAPGLVAADARTLGLAPRVRSDVTRLRLALRGAGQPMTTIEEATYLLGFEELLPGWYEDWVITEREHLKEGIIDRISQVVHLLVSEGDVDHALPLARVAIQLEPMRESAHRALARIHLIAGDRVAAWQVYAGFRRRSVTEFGVSPSQQFEELVEPLRAERRARRASGLGERRPVGVPGVPRGTRRPASPA